MLNFAPLRGGTWSNGALALPPLTLPLHHCERQISIYYMIFFLFFFWWTVSNYAWFELNSYGPCSTTCGQGTQTQLVWCVDKSSAQNFFQVADSFCSGIDKPEGDSQPCNLRSCPAEREWPGKWLTTIYSEV